MNQDIKKVKLLKVKGGHGLTITFDMTDEVGAPGNGGIDYKGLIHNDLKTALQGLAIHYGVLLGLINVNQVEDIIKIDPLLTQKISISGYSLGGDDGEGTEGIVITGHFIGPRKKAIIVNTPFELFDCAPESRYIYMDDFIAKVRVVDREIGFYLTGEKRGEPAKEPVDEKTPQTGDLFNQQADNSETVTKAQILPPIDEATGKAMKIPPADKDAQERIAADSNDELGGKSSKKTAANKKRVKQTAENPGGDAQEGEQ